MARPRRSTCRSCGGDIFFATSRSTLKSMPIDARPVKDGNIKLETIAGTRYAVVVPEGGQLYVSHFAVCPAAKKHRKRIGSTSAPDQGAHGLNHPPTSKSGEPSAEPQTDKQLTLGDL